mmetsp:Transcript_97912/g.219132  ORF Transcript_97912/g.219132 Transcript_97912/m.219132 type:complete len:223 (-) Transcript_97912:8-676(-)
MVQPRIPPINLEQRRAVNESKAFLGVEGLDCADIPLTFFNTWTRSLHPAWRWTKRLSRRCSATTLSRRVRHLLGRSGKFWCLTRRILTCGETEGLWLAIFAQQRCELDIGTSAESSDLLIMQPDITPKCVFYLRTLNEAIALVEIEVPDSAFETISRNGTSWCERDVWNHPLCQTRGQLRLGFHQRTYKAQRIIVTQTEDLIRELCIAHCAKAESFTPPAFY